MPAMSPRTQQLQAGMNAGPDQEAQLFEQGFSEMAYSLLMSRMPDVMQDVVTFKVLDVTLDKGTGVGAFVLLRQGTPIYIPVVMCDNAIKPLDIFYHKSQNVFLPLTKGWLDEIDKNALTSMGAGVKTPETLYTDVDIRNVVVPPITGRFSYAAWMPRALHDVSRVLTVEHLEATTKVASDATLLLQVLAQAPNRVKQAFANFLTARPSTFRHAAATYGVSALQSALRPRLEKVAAKQHTGGALWLADKDAKPASFQRVFGAQAAEAYTGVRLKGFAARDTRTNRNIVVQEQPYASWVEPKAPGVYVLYDQMRKEHPAFVMPMPVDLFDEGDRYADKPAIPAHTPRPDMVYPYGRPSTGNHRLRRSYGAAMFLAVLGNGDYIETDKLVGSASMADEIAGALHKRMFVDVDGSPRVGKGFFVRQTGSSFEATLPIEIKSISDVDGVRRIKATNPSGFRERTFLTDPKSPRNALWMPQGADIVYVPTNYLWIPLKEKRSNADFFRDALDLQACVSHALSSVGAKKVVVKDAAAGQFSVDGQRAMSRIDALKKLAYEQRISVDDADALLTKAAADARVEAWVTSMPQLAHAQMKLAGDDDKKSEKSDKPKKKSPPSDSGGGGDPMMEPGMDPTMDPSMGMGDEAAMAAMGPPPPPPPAPLDLAAMEMEQAIQHEEQKLLERRQTIQMLLARSSEISGGAPIAPSVQTQSMGAPPPSMNMATGAPGMPPGMAPTMGMAPMPGQPVPQDPMDPSMAGDPSMMGGDPSMGGMGGDPSMMGGQPPMGGMGGDPSMMGGDPSMGGQPPGGMDPSMMGGAMMPPDGPNTQALQSEVNPQFLDQAAQLHSADMFDAAAVAMLAQSPALHSAVAQHLPNLEKAVDNLGRVMLTLRMQEYDLKAQIGEATFTGLEENLQSTLKQMGDLVLRLSRGVQALKEPDDHAT